MRLAVAILAALIAYTLLLKARAYEPQFSQTIMYLPLGMTPADVGITPSPSPSPNP